MKVFALTFESNTYQSLVAQDLSIWSSSTLKFDGTSKIETWQPPVFRVQNPKLERGDFVGVGPGCLGFSSIAGFQLLDTLERSGEILEIYPKDLDVSILNVTECADCLDHDRVEWVYGEESKLPIRIKTFSFVKDLIPESTIFKIPEMAKAKIFVHDGFGDPEDTFIYQVEKLRLRGIRFDLIWSEDLSR